MQGICADLIKAKTVKDLIWSNGAGKISIDAPERPARPAGRVDGARGRRRSGGGSAARMRKRPDPRVRIVLSTCARHANICASETIDAHRGNAARLSRVARRGYGPTDVRGNRPPPRPQADPRAARRRSVPLAGGGRRARRARLGRGTQRGDARPLRRCRLPPRPATSPGTSSTGRTASRSSSASAAGSTISGRTARIPRGLWRRVDAAGYRAAVPDGRSCSIFDHLAATEGEDWVWAGATILRDALDRALVRLSRGGKDAAVIREFDLDTRTFVADGFVLPEGKGGATWLDTRTVLLSSALGRDGHAVRLRAHRPALPRGTDPRDASVLFETAETSMAVWGASDRQTGTERITVVGSSASSTRLSISAIAAACARARPAACRGPVHRDHLSVRLRRPWTVDGVAPTPTRCWRSRSPTAGGRPRLPVLWQPDARLALQRVFWSAGG